jgi:hypothetical protein
MGCGGKNWRPRDGVQGGRTTMAEARGLLRPDQVIPRDEHGVREDGNG